MRINLAQQEWAALAVACAAVFTLMPGSAYAVNPVVITKRAAPPLVNVEGTGLCMASAESPNAAADFGGLTHQTYNNRINMFMEAHVDDRDESVLRTPLDVSNNLGLSPPLSHGDFTNAVPGCPTGGCFFPPGSFPSNDPATAFGSRLRGFLNVTPDLVGKRIHFGFYNDDAVSLILVDQVPGPNGFPWAREIIIRPPAPSFPSTWRNTWSVQFEQEGLYPIEVLYNQNGQHAALEMSRLISDDFTDIVDQPVPDLPSGTSLKDVGFTLWPRTAFFQTLSGAPSYPQDLDKCRQCDRKFVNKPGNSGCDPGYYCNEAALCAPCDTANFCGPTCSVSELHQGSALRLALRELRRRHAVLHGAAVAGVCVMRALHAR